MCHSLKSVPFSFLLAKAERFCAYQERCRYEVEQKMKELGTDDITIEKVISFLEENNFLDEKRFAMQFASGKFRIKKWGKNKIRSALRVKKIPDEYIKNGLNQINAKEYLTAIKELAKKKEKEISNLKQGSGRMKIRNYLLSKGFENEMITLVLSRS